MAEPTDQMLEDITAVNLPLGSTLGPVELSRLLAEIGLPDQPLHIKTAVESAVREWAAGTKELAFQPGGWKVNVTTQTIQAAVSAGLIWGVLSALQLAVPIPAILVSAIIPRLFAVERVRLTRTEQEIIATLAIREDALTGSADELYAKLPQEIQDELNLLDFRELLDKVVSAGKAERSGEEAFVIYPPGKAKFRVKFE